MFQLASPRTFQAALVKAAVINKHVLLNVQIYDVGQLSDFYLVLTDDNQSGFAIKPDGELTAVFSAVKGRGELLVKRAIELGASRLNAFDGYLTSLYSRCGFIEYKRETNWTVDGPAVVYMSLLPRGKT